MAFLFIIYKQISMALWVYDLILGYQGSRQYREEGGERREAQEDLWVQIRVGSAMRVC